MNGEGIMHVNGQQIPMQNGLSLQDFLVQEGYDLHRVAVEKNGHIVPKANYETEMLANCDKLEIVHFVGGG